MLLSAACICNTASDVGRVPSLCVCVCVYIYIYINSVGDTRVQSEHTRISHGMLTNVYVMTLHTYIITSSIQTIVEPRIDTECVLYLPPHVLCRTESVLSICARIDENRAVALVVLNARKRIHETIAVCCLTRY